MRTVIPNKKNKITNGAINTIAAILNASFIIKTPLLFCTDAALRADHTCRCIRSSAPQSPFVRRLVGSEALLPLCHTTSVSRRLCIQTVAQIHFCSQGICSFPALLQRSLAICSTHPLRYSPAGRWYQIVLQSFHLLPISRHRRGNISACCIRRHPHATVEQILVTATQVGYCQFQFLFVFVGHYKSPFRFLYFSRYLSLPSQRSSFALHSLALSSQTRVRKG